MASVHFKNVSKVFSGGVKAVSDLKLRIEDKEFIVIVGPSGCGKSTVLRMIAGLEQVSAGELLIDGKVVNDVSAKDRDIAMVFQNYGLYPHMSVYDNMAFGLKLRGASKAMIEERVMLASTILDIKELLDRKPKQLSGGQQQRVALGRAIVRQPKVFLLDEPLSSLDAKLRVAMRTEITKLHSELGTTFVYVTHDQVEAMTMGTRIVVMKDGVVQQVDSPQSLYDNPNNMFVASFLGSPQMNFFDAVLVKEGDRLFVTFGENKILIPHACARRLRDENYIGSSVVLGVRAEDMHEEEVFIANSPQTVINAKIDVLEKLGNETILYMKIDGKEEYAIARVDARSKAVAGDDVRLAIDANHIHLFDCQTENSILGVPKMNQISGKLVAKNGKLSIDFGKSSVELNDEIIDRMVDLSCVNEDVILEISPMYMTDKKSFERLQLRQIQTDGTAFDVFEMEGIIDFTENHKAYIASYVKVEGKNGYVVAGLPQDSDLSSGDKIILCAGRDKIQIRDPKTSELMVSQERIASNSTKAVCVSKGEKMVVTFGKTKLTFDKKDTVFETKEFEKIQSKAMKDASSNKPQPIDITLNNLSFSIDKDDIAKNNRTCIDAKLVSASSLGEDNVINASVEGFDDVVSAVVCQSVLMNKGEKFKFAFDPSGIELGKPLNRKDAIAKLSK